MADQSDETQRATEILEAHRGVSNRLGAPSPRESMSGPFAPRFFPERASRIRRETERRQLRELSEHRVRSLLQVPTPLPIGHAAAVAVTYGRLMEQVRPLVSALWPALGTLEDLHTAVTGQRVDLAQLGMVDATPAEQILAIISVALDVIPIAGEVLAQRRQVVQLARQMRRSFEEAEEMLRAMRALARREQLLHDARAALRGGRSLTGAQLQALNDLASALRRSPRGARSQIERLIRRAERHAADDPIKAMRATEGRLGAAAVEREGSFSEVGAAVAPGAVLRRRGTGALSRVAGLERSTQEWLVRTLELDAAGIARVAKALAKADPAIRRAVDAFHGVDGFAEVMKDLVFRGWRKRQGAEFVLRFAVEHFGHRGARSRVAMIFERREARAAGLRLVDLVVEGGTRFEFKSIGLRTLSRFNRNSYRQMLKDLIDEAGSDLLRLRRRRWVFDSRKLRGVSRDDIVRLFQKLLRKDRWFRTYPLREQFARAITEMVVVWP